MRVIAHREKPFPDGLEGRLNAMLNVVNTELKTVTLLHLDSTPIDDSEIKARIRDTIGRGCYLPQSRTLGAYCHNTLFPIGTVAEEEIIRDTGETVYVGYKLTEAGKKYGLPIAAFTLDYTVRNNRSMFSILGSTQSHGKTRAPLNRVKILEALREKPLREVDLAGNLGLGSIGAGVLLPLTSLVKIGFVQYESIGELSKGMFPYLWVKRRNPREAQVIGTYPTATHQIARLMSGIKRSDCNEISELTGYAPNKVSAILSGLEKQGLLKRERWKVKEFQSEARLLDEGRRFLDEYIEPIKNALLDRQSLRDMQEFYERLMHDSDRFGESTRKLIAVYKKVSPHINAKPRQETNGRIIVYLRRNPGRRNIEIGKEISLIKPSLYLTLLVKAKVLRKEKKGKEVRYYVN